MATRREYGCCEQQATCEPDCDSVDSDKKLEKAREDQHLQLASTLGNSLDAINSFQKMVYRDLVDLVAPKCSAMSVRHARMKLVGFYLEVEVTYNDDAELGSLDRDVENLFSQYGLQRNKIQENRKSTSWEFFMPLFDNAKVWERIRKERQS